MSSDEKDCPFCAETIKAAAKKCKHCGEMLDGSLPPSATMSAPPALSSGADDQLFSLGDVIITSRVIRVGSEAIQIANINSVKLVEIPDTSGSGKALYGGCSVLFGMSVVALSLLSMQGGGSYLGLMIFGLSFGFLGAYLLKDPAKAKPSQWGVVINNSRFLAQNLSNDDALGMEKAINEAFSRLRTTR